MTNPMKEGCVEHASEQINYVSWARDTSSPRGLSRAQRVVLKELASRVNSRRGTCDPSVGTIADATTYSVGHVKRVLCELERLELVRSTRRGRDLTSIRQLCPDAPMPAPPCERGTQPLFDAALAPMVAVGDEVSSQPHEVSSQPHEVSSDETQKLRAEEVVEGGNARDAREHPPGAPSEQPAPDALAPGVLEPSLTEVLAVLDAAPDLFVEPLAVNALLAGRPQARGYDHVRAAWDVAAEAYAGRVYSAQGLLKRVLDDQMRGKPVRRGGTHEGRVRREVRAFDLNRRYASE